MFVSLNLRRALVLGAVALAVAACGRRGDLEPPSANAVQTPTSGHDLTAMRRPNPKITPPSGSFVLDPLLQ